MEEERLDKIILQRGLVSTRVRCEQIIQESGVLVNGKLINKPGKKFPIDVPIELLSEEIPWVSRGALKLEEARKHWQLDFANAVVLDVGASTGGFTEIALENGASKVFCVDVGTGQLHSKIKENPKVVNLEKTHVRELTSKLITEKVDIVVIDVSFISLEKIFPFIHGFLKEKGVVISLIKPQFEVGKENVGKGGIVKNKNLYAELIEKIKEVAKINQLIYQEHIESPILGGDGNREFLMKLSKN
jgi:23S rRNA (cytidine1920-2'-O)/16S rRNA (cytidine1409-2'-O)-methyltransferase